MNMRQQLTERLPRPLAITWDRCRTSDNANEFESAIAFFIETALSFLHCLAVCNQKELRGCTKTSEYAEPGFRWKFGNANSVFRSWETLRGVLPDEYLPLSPEKFFSQYQPSTSIDEEPPFHWANALASITRMAERAVTSLTLGEQAAAIQSFVSVAEDCLSKLLLDWLANWQLIAVLDEATLRDGQQSQLLLNGTQVKLNRSRALPKGLYAVAGEYLIGLDELVSYQRPIWFPEQKSNLTSRYLAFPCQLTEKYARSIIPELFINTPETERTFELRRLVKNAHQDDFSHDDFGYACVHFGVCDTRQLNMDFGYDRISKFLNDLDKYVFDNFQSDSIEPGPLWIRAFWRKNDELWLLVRFQPTIPESNLWASLVELVADIAAFCFKHWPADLEKLKLEVGLVPSIEGDTTKDFATRSLHAYELSRKECKNLRRSHHQPALTWAVGTDAMQTRTDHPFTRLSIAAFGVIRRRDDAGEMQVLTRFNKKHKAFGFVGGHREHVDQSDPQQTVCRELLEEIGLVENTYRFAPLAPWLAYTAYSSASKQHTFYINSFYWCDLVDPHVELKSEQQCRWVSLTDWLDGKLAETHSNEQLNALVNAVGREALLAGHSTVWTPLQLGFSSRG